MSETVRSQYEAYPYPARDPREEARRLITGSPSRLAEVNHYLFQGRRDFSKPFRVLVAGGGTGDATIMLAQQLADAGCPAEITYLDLSEASMAICKARAEARRLTSLRFLQGSLLEVGELAPGPYDYIDCCGVLHHLEDPDAGLAALTSVLSEEGGIGIMVYGRYGREGVYPLQDLLARIGEGKSLEARIGQAEALLERLPPTNAFKRNPFLGDHKRGPAELVDLLLHSQDRSYSVPELVRLVEGAGLKIASFIEPARYEPATYVKGGAILGDLEKLPRLARAAAAEVIAGNMKLHIAYLSRGEDSLADPRDPAAIPLLLEMEGGAVAQAVAKTLTLTGTLDRLQLSFPLPRRAPAMLRLIDGKRKLREIFDRVAAQDQSLTWADFQDEFLELFQVMNGVNRMLLRCPR